MVTNRLRLIVNLAVMESYDSMLEDLCGDEVYGEYFSEPNSSSHGVRGAKQHQLLWLPPVLWGFSNEVNVNLVLVY